MAKRELGEKQKIGIWSGIIILLLILIGCVVWSMSGGKKATPQDAVFTETNVQGMAGQQESGAGEMGNDAAEATQELPEGENKDAEKQTDEERDGVIVLPFVPANAS